MSAISVSDDDLVLLCMVDGGIDKNCPCLLSGGGPEMNTDISGPGVRISFYLQAYFLSILSARSGSLDEITAALYTLVATNIAMTIASFILGFKPAPTISLQDAIVVFYLLSLSWVSVFTSLPAYNRFIRSDKTLKVISMIQSYVIFALGLALLITAPTFGSTPRCNTHAVAVVFRQFPVLNVGCFVALMALSLVILAYTILEFTDYRRSIIRRYRSLRRWARERMIPGGKILAKATALKTWIVHLCMWTSHNVPSSDRIIQVAHHRAGGACHGPSASKGKAREETGANVRERREKKNDREATDKDTNLNDPRQGASKRYDSGVFGTFLIELIVITVLWTFFVMNTELVIVRNHFDGGGNGLGTDLWQFGQILAMFLVVLPLINLIKVFRKHGFTRRYHRKRVHKHRVRTERHDTTHACLTLESAVDEERQNHSAPATECQYGPHFGSSHAPFFVQRPQTTAHISLHSIHSAKSVFEDRASGRGRDQRVRNGSGSAESQLSP